MSKSNAGLVAAGVIGGAVVIGGAYAIAKSKNSSTSSGCSGINLQLSGNTNPAIDTLIDYTVTVTQNSNPLANVSVTLTENSTQNEGTETTDSNGVATFSVEFSSSGSYTLTASINCANTPIYSNSLDINVGQQQCPCGQIWDSVLNECSALIPAVVVLPTEPTFNENFTVNLDQSSIQGQRWGGCNSPEQAPQLKINGQLVDSNGHGVGCQQLTAQITGLPSAFNGTAGHNEFQFEGEVNSAGISVSETDENGYFTVYIDPSVVITQVEYNNLIDTAGCYSPDSIITIKLPVTVSYSDTVYGIMELSINLSVFINYYIKL